jgi:hypothetical protein
MVMKEKLLVVLAGSQAEQQQLAMTGRAAAIGDCRSITSSRWLWEQQQQQQVMLWQLQSSSL